MEKKYYEVSCSEINEILKIVLLRKKA